MLSKLHKLSQVSLIFFFRQLGEFNTFSILLNLNVVGYVDSVLFHGYRFEPVKIMCADMNRIAELTKVLKQLENSFCNFFVFLHFFLCFCRFCFFFFTVYKLIKIITSVFASFVDFCSCYLLISKSNLFHF